MNCLFCKQNSDASVSVEHIIPESLGNIDHTLPKGLVCDSCNQYFAVKVEKPLLEQLYFKNLRHRARIESKKGRIPTEKALIVSPGLLPAEVGFDKSGNAYIDLSDSRQAHEFLGNTHGAFIVPVLDYPEDDNLILSRFLAKVAIEGLLYTLLKEEGWIDEIMNKPELGAIKRYARYGEGVRFWKYHQRRLYHEDTAFNHPDIALQNYQVLHEFKILLTEDSHCYFVMAIMGIEYAINLGGPSYDSYVEWLQRYNNKSVLDDSRETRNIIL